MSKYKLSDLKKIAAEVLAEPIDPGPDGTFGLTEYERSPEVIRAVADIHCRRYFEMLKASQWVEEYRPDELKRLLVLWTATYRQPRWEQLDNEQKQELSDHFWSER